jgi:UDP-N-acetylmuramate dehydrogenase
MDLIQPNMLLATQCRFEVGGPADWFAAVSNAAELSAALTFAREHGLEVFVYSGGSNLFFADAGFRGMVVRIVHGGWSLAERELPPSTYINKERSSPKPEGQGVVTSDLPDSGKAAIHGGAGQDSRQTGVSAPPANTPVVTASAGYELSALIRELAQHNLGGIEFLGNIPGGVGGAVVGNAGCYGRAIAEVFVEADVFDIAENRAFMAPPEFFEFSYRHSKLKFDPRYIVLSATLRLTPRPHADIMGEVEQELADRLAKHPHFAHCAGSFFKNPPGYPAWKVIGDAGLNGAHVGGARLSDKHANFLINEGGTAADILTLARHVMATVKARLDLDLEPEVRYIGEHGVAPI